MCVGEGAKILRVASWPGVNSQHGMHPLGMTEAVKQVEEASDFLCAMSLCDSLLGVSLLSPECCHCA